MKRVILILFILTFFLAPNPVWALTQTEVSQLYVAILGRASEGEGNTYWQTDPSSTSMTVTANVMLNTEAAAAYFGLTLDDNQSFIEHIYINTLAKTYEEDPEGVDYWVGMLDTGASRGFVVAALISAIGDYAPEGTSYDPLDLATISAYNRFTNRVEISDYMADRVEKLPENWAVTTSFSGIGLNVTEETATVGNAEIIIDGLAGEEHEAILTEKIITNDNFLLVKEKAEDLIGSGFSAGEGYGEIWIRDFNTFIELSCEVVDQDIIREKLLVFFKFQGVDGNIIDAYIPVDQIILGAYDYIYSELEPDFAAHKNTVETDQETSLIQAVFKYIKMTGDFDFLNLEIDGMKLSKRMEFALEFLMDHRYNKDYGLLWGGTTADWGDVQPEDDWGVNLTDVTHLALDIYDNAMFVIAIKNLIEIVPDCSSRWSPILAELETNIRLHLWDAENIKFRPHIYIDGSPFLDYFDENNIFYHGGTAVAIEAGLLSEDEILRSLEKMIENAEAIGAGSIGLTMYPAYPYGSFKNTLMTEPYTYQNGGDWTWFGGRMIQQLVNYGFVEEAYELILPMTDRVIKNNGFYEWYNILNEPKGSASYRGSAGVLYKAIKLLDEWALDPE